jgi:Protein of unknown function (DUF2752)
MSLATRRLTATGALAAGLFAAFVLYRFPPETSSFYPRCPVYLWLHLYCPGCGGTRALAALLHGHVRQALHWNAIVVVALPFACLFASVAVVRALRSRPFVWPAIPQPMLAPLLLLIGVFTVVRNFPGH